MKRIIFFFLSSCVWCVAFAQNITRVEYFFDGDPGHGSATAVSITPAPNITDFSFNISIASVTDGFHTLSIRARDANNFWSTTFTRPFYKLPTASLASAPNINKLEYFFDADPGFGAGTNVPVTAGTSVNALDVFVPLTSVSDGFHTISFRTRDANNNWSNVFTRPFYKLPASAVASAPNINKLEYFFDADPGFGVGTNVPVTAGTSVNALDVIVPLTSVSDGFHTISFRTRDVNNNWSNVFTRPFYKLPASAVASAPNINKLEYFFDADPGFGVGTNVPVTAGTSVNALDVIVPLTTVSDGFHTISFRTRDANNNWSNVFTRPFYKLPASAVASAPNITRLEYFIDDDEGAGPSVAKNINATITPGTSITLVDLAADVSTLSLGTHRISFRALDATGKWSIVHSNTFNMLVPEPTAQPTSLTFTNVQTTSMTVNWTAATGSPAGYIVLRKASSAPSDIPVDGIDYTVVPTTIGTSTVVYVGNAVTFPQSTLTSGVTYHYAVFAYSGTTGLLNYRTADPLRNSQTTLVTQPTAQPTSMTFSSVAVNSMTVGFTAASGAPAGYIGLRKTGSSPTDVPVNATQYAVGDDIGTSKVAFIGSGVSHPVTGLDAATVYFYDVFSYNGSSGSYSFRTTGPLENSRTTLAVEPLGQPTTMQFTAINGNSYTVNFTPPASAPAGYIAIRKIGSAPTSNPIDGTTYTAGNQYGDGIIAYVGSAASFNETGLNSLTQYFYKIYAFNGNGLSSNFIVTTPLQGNVSTLDEPLSIMSSSFPATFDKGGNLTVSITVNNASKASGVTLKYRGISEPVTALKSVVVTATGNKFERIISSSDLTDAIGLKYYFEATDLNQIVIPSSTGKSYVRYSAELPGLSFGNKLSNYSIIAVPFKSSSVTTVFSALGGYDQTQWRLYDYGVKNSIRDNREYNEGFFNTIDPGKGYWLIVRNSTVINPGTNTAVEVDETTPFTITLSPGWNLIGNPYNFPISWSEVRTASGLNANPNVATSLTQFSNGTLTANGTQLNRYRGAFIENRSTSNIQLTIPVLRNPNLVNGRIATKDADLEDEEWEIDIAVTDGDLTNAVGGIGMHPNATLTGEDAFDKSRVPLVDGMNMPELIFDIAGTKEVFNKEVVPTKENFTWQFDVLQFEGSPVKLNWSPIGEEGSKKLYILDPVTQRVVDMKAENELSLSSNSKAIKVLFGNPDYIARALEQELPTMGQPYPNPARKEVTIPFYITEALDNAKVTVRVFNNVGSEVTILADDFYKMGRHLIKWEPDVKSGLYFITMKVGSGEEKRVKIVIQ